MLTMKGVSDPAAIAQEILDAAASDGRAGKFSTWSIKVQTYKEKKYKCLVHKGSDPEEQWENKGSFRVVPDAASSEVGFYWNGGDGSKYGYIHGRLLEQLATHYRDRCESIIYSRPK